MSSPSACGCHFTKSFCSVLPDDQGKKECETQEQVSTGSPERVPVNTPDTSRLLLFISAILCYIAANQAQDKRYVLKGSSLTAGELAFLYNGEGITMNMSEMIKVALEKKGYRNLKDASKILGISPELVRVIINKGHVPKDKTLRIIAAKLGLDKSSLILAAHQEKVPLEVKGYFLAPSESKYREGKRIYPLSQEQCAYLEMVLNTEEIQMIRKYRQVSEDGKTQIAGYIDFIFASKRELQR